MTSEEFTKIYHANFLAVLHTSLGLLHDRQSAEDIAAEVFIKLWQTDVSDVENMKGWLMKISYQLSLNIIRRRERIKFKDITDDIESTPSSEYLFQVRMDYMSIVIDRLKRMPTQCAKVCELSFIKNLENSEIAKILSIKLKTVSNQKIIGMGILRNKLCLK